MQQPDSRGPLSAALLADLTGSTVLRPRTLRTAEAALSATNDPLDDDDIQLSLTVCHELHYQGIAGIADSWEWQPQLVEVCGRLEQAVVAALRELVRPAGRAGAPIHERLRAVVAADDGPPLSAYLARRASVDQWREFVAWRSLYHLKEADPHTWAIPRLAGRAKAALVEIQSDEYGGGNPSRMHSALFARTMRALGLDDTYGAYIDSLPAAALAPVTTMTMFGLRRAWRGAIAGHLAALEMTSTAPNRRYGAGLRRLGLGGEAALFYDEHVEADAVHEQIAAVDLCGAVVAREPQLTDDILFGAGCALALDARAGRQLLSAWEGGSSARPVGGFRVVA